MDADRAYRVMQDAEDLLNQLAVELQKLEKGSQLAAEAADVANDVGKVRIMLRDRQ